ncbi:MAG TPA: Mov34/MPN/PAD-1 family protein [Mycobacteriales bacterium]|nr:Mov34/MPN/PAD-1 family protein [Mycobacteriales bacterium]
MSERELRAVGVLVARDALDDAVRAGRDALPKETGGILLGFRTPTQVVVTRVIVVEDPRSSRTRYQRRRRRAQQQLMAALADAPGVLGYVGEWHTHPENQQPSSTDVSAVAETARLAGGPIAMLVIAYPGTGPPRVHARAALRRGEWPIPAIDIVDVLANALTISEDTGDAIEHEASATITTIDTEGARS